MLLISIWFLFSSLLKVCCLYFSIAPFILCSTYTKHMHHKGDILLYTVIGRRLLSAAAKGEDHSILQTFKVLIIQNIQQLNNNQLMLNEEEEGSTFEHYYRQLTAISTGRSIQNAEWGISSCPLYPLVKLQAHPNIQ